MAEDRLSFEVQAQEALSERLRFWKEQIELALANNSKDLEEIGSAAQEELDELWEQVGMMDVRCLVSGSAIFPEVVYSDQSEDALGVALEDKEADGVKVQAGYIQQTYGNSKGFVFSNLGVEGAPPRLWYMFKLAETVEIPHPVMRKCLELYAFFDTADCSIVPLSKIDEAFGITFDEEQDYEDALSLGGAKQDILNDRSKQFMDTIRSTKFRRLSRNRQIRIIDQFVEKTEVLSDVRENPVMFEPQYVYISKPRQDGSMEYETVGVYGMTLSGICLAVHMLGREQLDRNAIRRDRDLVSKWDGLCLTVALEPDQHILGKIGLAPNSYVHVPISGQDFDIIFSPRRDFIPMER